MHLRHTADWPSALREDVTRERCLSSKPSPVLAGVELAEFPSYTTTTTTTTTIGASESG